MGKKILGYKCKKCSKKTSTSSVEIFKNRLCPDCRSEDSRTSKSKTITIREQLRNLYARFIQLYAENSKLYDEFNKIKGKLDNIEEELG